MKRDVHFNPSCDSWHPTRVDVVPFDAGICGAAPMFEKLGERVTRRVGGVPSVEPIYGNELSGFTQTKDRKQVTCAACIAAFAAFDKKRAESPNYYPWPI